MKDLEQKRKQIETAAKVIGFGLIGFFVAPFVFIAVKGIIGMMLAVMIALIGINLTPWIGAKLANWRLKLIKDEAAKNPIETMENEFIERSSKLDQFKQHIREFGRECLDFKGKLEEFKSKFPENTQMFLDQYNNMRQLLALRTKNAQVAQAQLDKFSSIIEKSKAIWEMAQAAAKMSKKASELDSAAVYSKIKTETALDSVTSSMNQAFADLEFSLMDEQSQASATAVSLPQPTTPQSNVKSIEAAKEDDLESLLARLDTQPKAIIAR